MLAVRKRQTQMGDLPAQMLQHSWQGVHVKKELRKRGFLMVHLMVLLASSAVAGCCRTEMASDELAMKPDDGGSLPSEADKGKGSCASPLC